MLDMTISVICFASGIVGMVMTMLMSWMFLDSRGSGVNQVAPAPIVADQGLDEHAGSMILGKTA